jgi:Zinc finger, C3HC4 type (RING finger)
MKKRKHSHFQNRTMTSRTIELNRAGFPGWATNKKLQSRFLDFDGWIMRKKWASSEERLEVFTALIQDNLLVALQACQIYADSPWTVQTFGNVDEVSGNDEAAPAPPAQQISEEKECKICMDRERCIVFMPCGHMNTCQQCADVLHICSICRTPIQTRQKVFM